MDDYKPKKWTKAEERELKRLFKKGLSQRTMAVRMDRTERSVANRLNDMRHENDPDVEVPVRAIPWFRKQGMKIGFLDIETTDLAANHGFMLSWFMKVEDEKRPRHGIITPKECTDPKLRDKRIVTELLEAIQDVHIVATFYGTGFDIPYMRSRALFWDLPFPEYGSIYHFDLFYRARSNLRLHRRNLGAVSRFLRLQGKTGEKDNVDIELWMEAGYGDKTALGFIVEHNKKDVEILQNLFQKLEPYSKWTRKSI